MILKKDWGSSVRLRVFTRRKHNLHTPTKEQLKKVLDTGEYKGKVTAGEIQKAFDCGQEVSFPFISILMVSIHYRSFMSGH
jgi:hypothetical protein